MDPGSTPSTAPHSHGSSASVVCVLGISAIIVAQWDWFTTPKHQQEQECSGLKQEVASCLHAVYNAEDFIKATMVGQAGWFLRMALMHHQVEPLCRTRSRALLPWKNSTYASVSSDPPCPGSGSCLHPLLWCLQSLEFPAQLGEAVLMTLPEHFKGARELPKHF